MSPSLPPQDASNFNMFLFGIVDKEDVEVQRCLRKPTWWHHDKRPAWRIFFWQMKPMIIQGILEKKKRRFFAASRGFPFQVASGIANSPGKNSLKIDGVQIPYGKPQHKLEGPFLKNKMIDIFSFSVFVIIHQETLLSPAARTSSSNWLKAPSALPLSSKNAPTAPFPKTAKFGQDLMIYTWNLFGLYFGGWSFVLQNKV